jgi:hypothetical protein
MRTSLSSQSNRGVHPVNYNYTNKDATTDDGS